MEENDFIANALDSNIGKIIKITPELEHIIGISECQADIHGNVA